MPIEEVVLSPVRPAKTRSFANAPSGSAPTHASTAPDPPRSVVPVPAHGGTPRMERSIGSFGSASKMSLSRKSSYMTPTASSETRKALTLHADPEGERERAQAQGDEYVPSPPDSPRRAVSPLQRSGIRSQQRPLIKSPFRVTSIASHQRIPRPHGEEPERRPDSPPRCSGGCSPKSQSEMEFPRVRQAPPSTRSAVLSAASSNLSSAMLPAPAPRHTEVAEELSHDVASPLRSMSRRQLEEQLTAYASAYVDEKDAHDLARQKVDELSHIADTSTQLAEESDQNCKALLQRLEDSAGEIADFKLLLSDARRENSVLADELRRARLESTEARHHQQVAEARMGVAEEQLRPLQREHERLRLQCEHHGKELATVQAQAESAAEGLRIRHESDTEHLRTTVGGLEVEVRRLRQDAAAAEEAHGRERTALNERLRLAHQEADGTRVAVEALRTELRAAHTSAEDERSSHSRQEKALTQEIESLRGRCAALSAQYEQCQNRRQALEREVVTLQEAHNAMTVKVKTTLAELEATDAEKESRRMLERQNAEMERQIADLRATLQTFVSTRRMH